MKVLVLFNSTIDPQQGGVERVYSNLAPFFIKHGIEVYAYYFDESLFDKMHVYNGIYRGLSKDFNSVYKDLCYLVSVWNISHIICGFPTLSLMRSAEKLPDMMVFHHIHNVPSRLFDYNRYRSFKIVELRQSLRLWLSGFRIHNRYLSVFRAIEKNGHYVILLSDKFREDLYSVFRMSRLIVKAIPNPFLIDSGFVLNEAMKEKTLLYVGRLEEKQKNVSSLLRIWKILQGKLLEYNLLIVGDGPDRLYYEDMAKRLGLERYAFTGFKSPTEYYKRSSVLLMTSKFEGFPMVLIEAMQYGCVPFAYNSYAALQDIIKHEENGFIITPFDENEFADSVQSFLSDSEENRLKVRLAAMETARQFDVEIVGQEWLKLFHGNMSSK